MWEAINPNPPLSISDAWNTTNPNPDHRQLTTDN
jgi:hypothetical protein